MTDNGKVFSARFGTGPGPVAFDRICHDHGIRRIDRRIGRAPEAIGMRRTPARSSEGQRAIRSIREAGTASVGMHDSEELAEPLKQPDDRRDLPVGLDVGVGAVDRGEIDRTGTPQLERDTFVTD